MLRASLCVAGRRRLELALQRLRTGGPGAGQQDEEAADQDGRPVDVAARDRCPLGSHRRRPPAGDTSIDRAMTSKTI